MRHNKPHQLFAIILILASFCLSDAEATYTSIFQDQVFSPTYFSTQGSHLISQSSSPDFSLLISNCTFECSAIAAQTISDFSIDNAATQYHSDYSLFEISNSAQVRVENSTFKNCYLTQRGGIFKFQNSSVQMVGVTFQNNAASLGGAIYSISSNLTIQDSQFIQNMALEGGSIYLQDQNNIALTNIIANDNFAYSSGGFLTSYSDLSSVGKSVLSLQNLHIQNNSAYTNGGVFAINNSNQEVYLQDGSIFNSTLSAASTLLTASSRAKVVYIERASYVSLLNIEVNQRISLSSQNQVAGSLILSKMNNQDFKAEIKDCQFKIIDEMISTQDLENICFQNQDLADPKNFASFISLEKGSLVSRNNSFSQSGNNKYQSIFNMANGNFLDDLSQYKNLTLNQSVIVTCSNCTNVRLSNIKTNQVYSCQSSGSLVLLNGINGSYGFYNVSAQAKALTKLQHLVYLNSNEYSMSSFVLKNVSLNDSSDYFETGLLFFSKNALIENLTASQITVAKKEYFSSLISASALNQITIAHISTIFGKDMKSEKLFQNQTGIINIPVFSNLTVQNITLNCSSYQASQYEQILGKKQNSISPFNHQYNALFKLDGLDKLQYQDFCQRADKNCSRTKVDLQQIRMGQCYNFENGVLLQCTNCWNISLKNSSLNFISKIPEYNGERSGFFQTDSALTYFTLLNCSFTNIVTEGNMIMESYMLDGWVYFNYSNFSNIHSTLKTGGILMVAYETQIMEKLFRTNENYFYTSAKQTSAVVTWSVFRNISSENDGSIFYQRPFYLKKIDMYDNQFHNVTSEKAGAILRVQGNMYYRGIVQRAVFRGCFAYGGAVFDYDYTILQGPFFYTLDVQCFPSDSDLIINALEKKTQFKKLPGPFIQVRMFRQYVGIQTSTFSNCVTFEKGAIVNVVEHDLFYAQVSNFYRSVYIVGCNFYNNTAQQGGAISSQVGDPSILQSNFINNTAVIGGAVSVETPMYWSPCDTVKAINNRAYLKGGFISITQDKTIKIVFFPENYYDYTYDYYFYYSTFQNNSAIYGGVANIEAELVQMTFYQTSFSNQSASFGGDVYFIYSYYLVFDTCSSYASKAKQGSVIYMISEEQNNQHEIYNTLIDCKNLLTPNLITGRGTVIYIDTFKVYNCRANPDTSLINFKNTYRVYSTRSNYTNNSGSLGGVFYLQNALLSIYKSGFINNSAIMGGAIYLGGNAKVYDIQAYYKANRATKLGGAIYGSSNASVELYQSQFWNNQANEGSAIFIVGARASRPSEKYQSIDIQGSLFSNNTSNISTITIIQGNTSFISNRFQDNYAKNSSNAIVALMAGLYFRSNTFTSSPAAIANYKSTAKLTGGYIHAVFSVNLTLASITIQNGLAVQGSAIYLGSQSFANLTRVLFQNNTAIDKGGVIYAKDTKQFNIDLCQFYNNTAGNFGDEIYLSKTNEPFLLSSTIFTNYYGRQLIYTEMANVSFTNLTMTSMQFTSKSEQGGAMHFQNSDSITIKDSNFKNFQAESGGAIYVWESSVNLQNRLEGSLKYQTKNHTIINTTFGNCSAYKGGALYLENSNSFILSNVTISNNTAMFSPSYQDSGNGGAIYFTSYGTSSLTQLYLSSSNSYVSNTAQGKGGVFYWDELEPYYLQDDQQAFHFSDLSSTSYLGDKFVNNTALLYGNNFASFASKLKYFSDEEVKNEAPARNLMNQEPVDNYTVSNEGDNLRFSNFRSGEALRLMKVAIVDIYDQVIVSDNSSVAQVLVDTSYNSNDEALRYPPIVEGSNSFEAEMGIFTLDDMTFYASPGYNHSIQILTTSINLSKQSNQQLMLKLNTSDLGQRVIIELRKCLLGEMFTPSGKCQYCQEPTYILEELTSPANCLECPENSICLGGSIVGPKPGYQRSRNNSVYQVKCPKSEACLGFLPPYENFKGDCAEGYQGVLCADCSKGYVKGRNHECEICPDPAIIYLKVIGSVVGWILLCILLVYSTYLSAQSKLIYSNIYLKMLLNHIQQLMVSWSLNFEFQNELLLMGQEFINASTVSSLFLNFSCLLDRDEQSQPFMNNITRVFSLKMIVLTFLPLACLALCYSALIFYRTRIRKYSSSLFISSLVISLFIVYPSVIHRIFQQFQFRELDGVDRLLFDLEILKDSQEHAETSLYFCLPSLIVWGFGLPALAFKILHDLQGKMEKQSSVASIGFLYRGYQRKYRFWEAVISLRKIGTLILITFTRELGLLLQTLFVMAVYTLFIFLNLNLRPFSISDFSQLENLSLFVQALTLYLSLYLSVNRPKEWVDQNIDNSGFSIQLSANAEQALGYFIFIVNALYFCVWLALLIRNSKSFFLSRFTKTYMMLSRKKSTLKSSLSSSAVTEKDIKMREIKEEQIHQLYLEEYHSLVLQISQLYFEEGTKINEETLSRMRNYLHKSRVQKLVNNLTFQSLNPQERSFNANEENLRFESEQNDKQITKDKGWTKISFKDNISMKKLKTKSFKSKGNLSLYKK